MTQIERSDDRDQAIEAILSHVPLDGWTVKAIRAGLRDAGQDPEAASSLFPGGVTEVIEAWCDLADRRMAEALAVQTMPASTRARVVLAIRTRLDLSLGQREAVRRALVALARPDRAGASARTLARTVDAIWHAAGDRSTDFSWYTKRASLGAIYGATLLFWLNDESDDQEATDAFLGRRLDGLMLIPRARQKVKQALTQFVPRRPKPA